MRSFVNAFFLTSLAWGFFAVSEICAAESSGRIAIIDASLDVRPFIPLLRDKGIKVVGRYYARCKQPEIPGLGTKRLVDNDQGGAKREVDALLDAGFGIVSVYQYFNNSPQKFSGLGTIKFPPGKSADQVERALILPADDCSRSATEPNSAEKEGQLDANAAVKQAVVVGQPKGSAIYFGVDFDTAGLSEETWSKIKAYFVAVRAILKASDYRLGIYGDGATLEHLDKLIDYKWILPSPAFNRVSEFYNKKGAGEWDLFQSLVDTKWKAGATSIELDGNVQSAAAAGKDIGFWDRKGSHIIDKDETTKVFERHRFVCNGSARVYKSPNADPSNVSDSKACSDRFAVNRVVRIGQQSGDFVEIDCDDDGTFDGWTPVGNLSKSFSVRPPYLGKKEDRAKQVCP